MGQPNQIMDYQKQVEQNKQVFMEVLKNTWPELHVLATQLDNTNANPVPLFHVIRHMAEIASGTGYGQVHILIEGGLVRFVRGEHSTKVEESVFSEPKNP